MNLCTFSSEYGPVFILAQPIQPSNQKSWKTGFPVCFAFSITDPKSLSHWISAIVFLLAPDVDCVFSRQERTRTRAKADQIVIFPRNVPKTLRITSEISPRVARAFTAARTGGMRFSLPRHAFSRTDSAYRTARLSRFLRRAARRCRCAFSIFGSTVSRLVGFDSRI